ncbi:unnamed protein product [Paramecium primaurelia]|uniref:GOLD domain-containing protein n=1 Tax=Paramecium primaurelia TaxID=5886 RepID=A0A8S1KI06_PARPR|nr:unnamed protein product [Paramecium primaurelia]
MRIYTLILICLINIGYSLSIQINHNPTCFYVQSTENNCQLIVNFQVSGMDENKTEIIIKSENNDQLLQKVNGKEGSLKQTLKEIGTYFICFKSLNRSFKTVSFDFDVDGDDKEYAQSEQFNQMSKELSRTNRNFQSIYRNQNWITDRENSHKIILENTQKSIYWCSITKIGVLILITILQTIFVYKFFKGIDVNSQTC